MPTKESGVLHFVIEGEWFTWMLRHLWIEGSEFKAIRLWNATFPDLATDKHLKKTFIDVVSGKKKFAGTSEGEGFDLVKDGRKFWNSQQGGPESKEWPLLRSWQDVLARKRIQLFVAELGLRWIRMNRKHADTHEGCGHNSKEWILATEENKVENEYRKEVALYWAEIRNLIMVLNLEVEPALLPTDSLVLSTLKPKMLRWYPDDGIISGEANYPQYAYCKAMVDATKNYLKKKYGVDLILTTDEDLKLYCGIDEERAMRVRDRKAIEDMMAANMAMLTGMGMGIDVDSFIKNKIADGNRDIIDYEDIGKTKWDSGFIDREGKYYGCSYTGHSEFSIRLGKQLGIFGAKEADAEIEFDEQGWVRMSRGRFYWKKNPSEQQRNAMLEFMGGHGIKKTCFNGFSEMTWDEEFGRL